MGKWTEKDTSAWSGDSGSKVASAFHDARNAASSAGELVERGVSKLADGGPVSWALHGVFKAAEMIGSALKK